MNKIDDKETVLTFLDSVHSILSSESFDIKTDFVICMYRARNNSLHTNQATLIELNYNASDVVGIIKKLSLRDYKDTIADNKPCYKKPFYSFIKTISDKQVYIKIKINEYNSKKIFCVSFHFVDYIVDLKKLPYNE